MELKTYSKNVTLVLFLFVVMSKNVVMNYLKFLFGFLFNQYRSSTQWVKGRGQSSTTMLNADMTIYKQFKTHGKFDTPSCSYNTCPDASTANVVSSACQTQLICYIWRRNIVQPMLLRVCHNRLWVQM